MKRVILTLVVAFFAVPGFGEDIDLGLGGDASSLLNIPAPRGNTPARGAPSGRGATGAASVDRLARLRQVLAQANAPLSPDQETGLNTLVGAEIPLMRRALQTRVADLQNIKVGKTAGRLSSGQECQRKLAHDEHHD